LAADLNDNDDADNVDDDADDDVVEAEPAAAAASAPEKKRREMFDSLNFTPGTEFMARLSNALHFYACSRVTNRMFQNVEFYVSDSSVEGEGEVRAVSCGTQRFTCARR
jgi:5'-3' exonuclease